jgi:hypothetical protein
MRQLDAGLALPSFIYVGGKQETAFKKCIA